MQVLVWLLVISLIVPMLPPPKASAAAELPMQITDVTAMTKFKDVNATDWFHDAVVQMQAKGIFSGTTADTFSPKGKMTRAMYITALGRMAGVDTGAYLASSFADVPVGSWYAPYIEWAVQKGITDGTGGSNYSPNATVSREQMATMTLRYFESEQIPYQTGTPLTTQPGDLANVSPWAADAVLKLWQAGVFTGDEKGNFNPRAQATRAEAAVLFMRNSSIVEAWKSGNPVIVVPTPTTSTPTPTPTPNTAGNSGGGTSGGNNGGTPGGNAGGGTPTPTGITYTLTFESNGGNVIPAQKVKKGELLNNLPVPTKEDFIFQGWFIDSDLSLIFASGSELTEDTTLYAKYTDRLDDAVESIPSYSVLDVAPNYTITLKDETASLTIEDVKAGIEFIDTANPSFEGVEVAGGNGVFTVSSAAEEGKFVEGNTYQLTLTDENLSFDGQDKSTEIYVFSVAKPEGIEIPLDTNLIYLPYADVKNMTLNGKEAGSLAVPVMTTTVDGSGQALADANATSGTFDYNGSVDIQIGATVAIYAGVRPDQRTVATDGVNSGDVAYVHITDKVGKTYTYGRAEVDEVLFKPDVLPVSITADTDGYPDNNSITVEHTVMNYSDPQYEELGLNELTTVDVGDFIGFYTGEFGSENGIESVGYGRITSVTSNAEMDIITYTDATLDDVTSAFDMYQKQAIDGEYLLSDEQVDQIERQIETQARKSGFVDQAADYLTETALKTKAVQSQAFLAGNDRVSVENLEVTATIGTKVKNIDQRSSGISASLAVEADIVVHLTEKSDLVIHMTAAFVQEISLSLNVNSETAWHWYKVKIGFFSVPVFPVIDDYIVTANLDTYTYTGLNITAEMALVEPNELEDALEDWDAAEEEGLLGDVRDIATEIQNLINGTDDEDDNLDADSLREQYQEMLEEDTEWVPLIEKSLFKTSVYVAYGLIEVQFEAQFVVKAKVNLSIGADFYYKSAKRYSVTLRILSFSGTSNTVNLPGDGDYQFTFYVMGTIGLRAGINMEVKAGVGSVSLNSIGISVEPGAYINLWGYFYYQLKNINNVKTTKSLGALYVEIGIYLEVALGAQLGDGALSAGVSLLDKEWPLYMIGRADNVYDFDYEQDEELGIPLAGKGNSIELPNSLLKMNVFDLKSGDTGSAVYDVNRFDIQVDNKNFTYDPSTRRIAAVSTTRPVLKGNLVITWKGAPLSFASDPIKRTIPLSWRMTQNEYIFQLDPRNGGATQILPVVYNTAVNVPTPVYPGYTFQGWYTAPSGGEKVEIPSRMPKEDYELYARWTANPNTPYTVLHYLIDPNTGKSVSKTPDYTEFAKGTTDTEIHINSDRFKAQGYANGVSDGRIIKGDESTVVKVEYYPAVHSASFNLGYPGAPRSSFSEPAGRNIEGRIPVPTRTGYVFDGWSPQVPKTMPDSSVEYTAQWIAKEDTPYQVVYLKQDLGSDTYTVADTESYRGATGAEANLDSVTPKVYPEFEFKPEIPGTVLTSTIASNGKTVLKLYYKRDTHKLKINYGGSGQADKEVDVPFGATLKLHLGTPIREGHMFTGWSPAAPENMPGEDISVTAQWSTNAYTINFESNGATEDVSSQNVDYGGSVTVPTEPTKNGFVFGGWYSDSSLTNKYDFGTLVTDNMTLYAKWLLQYTVSFDSMGGSPVDAQVVNDGAKATAPTAPTKDDYVFSGWYMDDQLSTPYNFTTAVVTGDITLYAKWNIYVPTTYTVSFESNGGTDVQAQIINEGAVANVPLEPMQSRYTFAGWYSDSDLTTPYGFTESVMNDLTLYAKWTLNEYTVTFNSNGGSAVSSQSVNDGDSIAAPEMPTRNGYVFGGWYSNSTLTNLYDFNTPIAANLSLYAKWTARYTVTFNSNGGSNVDSQTIDRDGKVQLPPAPTRDEYTFVGWQIDESLTQGYDFDTSVTNDLTLYAKWKSDKYTVSFDSNEGSAVEDQKVSPGGKASAPSTPTWEGYKFEGWYSDNILTNPYDFNTVVNADLTLYAKWTYTPWYILGNPFDARSAYQVVADSRGIVYATYEGGISKYANGAWTSIPGDSSAAKKIAVNSQDVLYRVNSDGDGTLFAQKFNGTGWEDLGRDKTLVGASGDGGFAGARINLAFDNNDVLYVVYNDQDDKLQVVKYVDDVWVPVVGGASLGGHADNPSLKFDADNNMYVFRDKSETINRGNPSLNGRGTRIVVLKYENAAWVALGDLGLIEVRELSETPYFEVAPDGTPYVLHSTPGKAVLTRYNGTEWEKVGEGSMPVSDYFTLGLAVDEIGTPYVAYEDKSNGNKASVAKYEGTWSKVGAEAYVATSNLTLRFSRGKDGNLYLIFVERNANKVDVMKHKIR
ncbi:InlB B-repeat-containing protein [Saccharibacillus endophyticus]